MQYIEQNQIPSLLMLNDYEKAFVTICWKFIYKCQTLDFFNFWISINNYILTCYNDLESCVIQNEIASDYFYSLKRM